MRSARAFAAILALLSVSLGASPAALARRPSPQEVSAAEAEWARAQKDYYEALKREPEADASRKAELDRLYLAPSREKLKKVSESVQGFSRPVSTPSRVSETQALPRKTQKADPTPVEAEPQAPLSPLPEPLLEFGRPEAPKPRNSVRPSRFKIEEVPGSVQPSEYKTRRPQR